MRYFAVLARTLNFTKAANECSISQPALTKAIQRLEEQLGGPLVHREGKLTHLTDFGRAMLPLLEKAIDASDAIDEGARNYRFGSRSSLRIGAIPSVSPSLMRDAISKVLSEFPNLTLTLIEERQAALLAKLECGEVDVALACGQEEIHPRIDRALLKDEAYCVVVSSKHKLAHRISVELEELNPFSWLTSDQTDAGVLHTARELFSTGGPNPIRQTTTDQQLQELALVNFGFLFWPEHRVCLPGLVKIAIYGEPLRRQVYIYTMAGRRDAAALSCFKRLTVAPYLLAGSNVKRVAAPLTALPRQQSCV